MESEIQFGDLEQAEPKTALRPDQDGHYVVAEVGAIAETDDLPIFVDLDVMRDMEAHALDNTKVELGGVMLGHQAIDDQGRPFVWVTDSLRALHYEATRGSFKFTHDTWSQITEDRKRFKPNLEMVGWYHTHPGWTVFLSPMDLFICDNFFNSPLDVALVIDPCNDDRGWFQWDASRPGSAAAKSSPDQPHRTQGFYLYSNRFREKELQHFAAIYNKDPSMSMDPRYQTGGSPMGGPQPIVVVPEKRTTSDIIMFLGLAVQPLIIVLIIWLFVGSTAPSQPQPDSAANLRLNLEKDAYRDLMKSMVAQQNGPQGLVDQFAQLQVEHQKLNANLDGQLARVEILDRQRQQADQAAKVIGDKNSELEQAIDRADQKIALLEDENKRLISKLDPDALGAEPSVAWWATLVGLATAMIGGLVGFFVARSMPNETDELDPPSDNVVAHQESFELASPPQES